MPTYLTKRGATYYFRRVIPDDLRPAFGGKRELTFSLGTKDRAEASRLCRAAAVQSDIDFEQAEAQLARPPATSLKSAETATMDRQAYAATAFASLQRQREAAFAAGNLAAFNARARDNLEMYQTILEGGDNLDLTLVQVEGMRRAYKALLADDGAAVFSATAVTLQERDQVSPPPETPMLPELIKLWAAERSPDARSVDMWRRTCAMFYAVVGEKPVGAITKADVIAFKAHLIGKGNAPATVDSRLNHLRSLFRIAVEQDIIPLDPAATVKAPSMKGEASPRRYYGAGELKAVFGSAIYTKGERPNRGAGEAAYWLPLLALYTGARLNEIGQLRPKDILQEVYLDADDKELRAWVIRITEDKQDGLRVKNPSSNRRVPIHQALIDLGFLRFVDAARDKGQARIFPDLKPDRYGVITGNWSKWYGLHLREVCGVSDKKITFHSFRHNFKRHWRECDLSKAANDAITGHESGSVADKYGGDYPLRPLVEGMARYRVPDFTLPPPPASLK
ncbi:DUF6538 domain-containing protein [Brevundimonas pishanensis]|uniref:DUF6538 domain-containing protein n=1 Tax=Brevundimonas pishanensis TaxID=2896315 RepID=UPI001FA6D041|nr:DUF6538 domain-containing protein [Brevundimonas pishanensis]